VTAARWCCWPAAGFYRGRVTQASEALAGGGVVGRPDQVSLGVLVAAVPRFKVDEAVAVCGVAEQRRGGKLPPHVTAYLTMALCLFAEDSTEEVAQKVTGSLSAFGVWDAGWTPPTSSGITQARMRPGRDVLRETFYRVARPVAQPATRGAWLRDRRLVAIDGFDVDVPDTAENAAEFGYAGNDQARSAFAKVRVVALTECGSQAFESPIPRDRYVGFGQAATGNGPVATPTPRPRPTSPKRSSNLSDDLFNESQAQDTGNRARGGGAHRCSRSPRRPPSRDRDSPSRARPIRAGLPELWRPGRGCAVRP